MKAMPVEGGVRAPVSGRTTLVRHGVDWLVFGVVPAAVFCWWLGFAIVDPAGDWGFDFRQFWQGGRDVWNGVSPYPGAALLATAGDHLGPVGIQEVFRFPYPAAAAVSLAPFGPLAFDVSAAIWGCLLVASLLGSVWVLGVRDWRVFGVVVGSAPVIGAVRIGTLTPLLLLLLAVTWRWRDRRWVAGGAMALAVSLKLFLWPFAIWLAATRRYAAALVAVVGAVALTLGAWALIGFAGIADYPVLLRRLSDIVADRGFSLVALGTAVGLPGPVAGALPWAVGVALLVWAVMLARRRDGDRSSFSVAVVAAIALSPIVWLHSFALLVVPLALAWPRLAWPWLLLWVFWLVPAQGSGGALWRVLLALAVTVAVVVRVQPRFSTTAGVGGAVG